MAITPFFRISNFIPLISKPYFFTLFFAISVLLVTVPYNLLVPEQNYCENGGAIKEYLMLTAPFNIGCEGAITKLGTERGKTDFLSNYALFLGLVWIMEQYYKNEPEQKVKIIFASILATYYGSIGTAILYHSFSAGTSIIAISVILATAYKSWQMMEKEKELKKKLLYVLPFSIMASLAINMSIGPGGMGHILGAGFFILFMLIMAPIGKMLRNKRLANRQT